MHHKFELEDLPPVEASALLADLAEQLTDGTVVIEGHPITVAGPMALSVDVDAGHERAQISITDTCHRPGGGSRRLHEELARPGG